MPRHQAKQQQPGIAIGNPGQIAYQLPGESVWRATSLADMARGFPKYEIWKDCRWLHIPPSPEFLQKILWRPIWCGGHEIGEDGKRKFHHFEGKRCHCPPGPQIYGLLVRAHEIELVGGRGSTKSETTLGFLAKGDPLLDPSNPLHATYLNSKYYKFLVLRKNANDLDEFFERAKQFFAPFGGTPSDNSLKFPSGAWGKFDHVANGDAPAKYQGQEWTRIAWEELTQEKSEESYLKILMSCRSSHPEMFEQMLGSANPGGPGAKWFNSRFVKFKKPDGSYLKSGEVYHDPILEKSRVFIFSTVDDNPYQLRKGYDKTLELLKNTQPTLYKRWRFGDFDAVEGQYFEAFREDRHEGEPPEACHVLKCTPERPEPIELADYWPRAIGVDWGYSHNSAVLWGCWHPKGQLHVYREMVVSRKGTVELGAEIALKSMEDLDTMRNQHMVIHLSPDAFARTDDTLTEAEQIAQGINSVWKDAAFVLAPTQEERTMSDADAWASVMQRQKAFAKKTHLTIVRAQNHRKSGWNLIRDYLRWWPLVESNEEMNQELAREILLNKGTFAYREYEQQFERRKSEVLPKILFWSCCPKIIAGIQAAIEDERDTEDVLKQDGDDEIDCLRYLCMGFPFTRSEVPKDVYVEEKLANLSGLSTPSLVMAARLLENKYDRAHAHSKGFNIPRAAGPSRRFAAMHRVQ